MSKVPFSHIAEIKPSRGTMRLTLDEAVSFIPMEDVSETGQWTRHRLRAFAEVRSGFTCFQENDILVAKITPCMENGKGCIAVGLRNGIGFGSTEFHVLRAIGDNDPRFVYHWTQAREMRLKAENFMIGSAGQQRVQAEFFNRFKIEEIDPAEQRRIAEILDTADEAIQKTEALIAKLKQMKAGLLHDLLTRGIDENGELRPFPSVAPQLYQETKIGLVPRDWNVDGLQSQSKPGRSFIRTGPFGSALKQDHWVKIGTPVVTIGSLGEGVFCDDELLFISESYANVLRDFRLQRGDIVFSRVADVGRSVVVTEAEDGWIMSSNLMRISLDESAADPHFTYLCIAHDERIRKQIRQSVNAGGREVANSQVMSGLKFPWPHIEEQRRIVAASVAHQERTVKERLVLDKLLSAKAGLMHDLLTGKKRVNQPAVATA